MSEKTKEEMAAEWLKTRDEWARKEVLFNYELAFDRRHGRKPTAEETARDLEAFALGYYRGWNAAMSKAEERASFPYPD